jgi:sugar phosphate permease
MNTALILLNLGMAASAPLLGRALDRFSVRRIMRIGAVVMGASFATLALSKSLLLSAIIMALPLAAACNAAGGIAVAALVARWFQAQRGRAMTISIIGVSFGSLVVAPAMGWLITNEGWRAALMAAAATAGGVLALLSFVVRDRPRPDEAESGAAAAAQRASQQPADEAPKPLPIPAILRAPQFWTLCLGVALATSIAQSVMISLVPLALQEGLTLMQATTLVSLTGMAALATKLLLAVVADRLDGVLALVGLMILGAVLNLALMTGSGYAVLAACAAGLGVATGVLPPLFYTVLAGTFGPASFGTARGLSAPFGTILGAGSVRFAGEVYDRTGGYDLLFATFIGLQVVAAVLTLSTRFVPAARLATPTPAV